MNIKAILIIGLGNVVGDVVKTGDDYVIMKNPIIYAETLSEDKKSAVLQTKPIFLSQERDAIFHFNSNQCIIYPFVPSKGVLQEYQKMFSLIVTPQ